MEYPVPIDRFIMHPLNYGNIIESKSKQIKKNKKRVVDTLKDKLKVLDIIRYM